MVDRQRDLRPCYVQNGSFLVAGASAKGNEDRDQSSTVPATGWDFTGVPGQEPVECGTAGGSHRLPRRAATIGTHPFNGPFSGTTQVSRYQKGKTNLDFTEARDSEWQWHQLGHMQVCASLQTDNHTTTQFFYRPDALPAAQQQRQSTEGICKDKQIQKLF